MRQVSRAHDKQWFEGPRFEYRLPRTVRTFTVDVTRSSRPIRGLQLSSDVLKLCLWLRKKRPTSGIRVLDFGAGAWLRYTQHVYSIFGAPDVCFVEYEEAFDGEAAGLLQQVKRKVRCHWEPAEFVERKKERFDLILLVNVLNAIPEETHRHEILRLAAKRLAPLGYLAVYQRIWYATENPEDSYAYAKDGWLISHGQSDLCTYRASTTNTWFNVLAKQEDLRKVGIPQTGVAGNTIFKVWEKRAL